MYGNIKANLNFCQCALKLCHLHIFIFESKLLDFTGLDLCHFLSLAIREIKLLSKPYTWDIAAIFYKGILSC